MNKEVIYLEPEDDITDILTKLQRAEQKLVALVPPKKAAMFRSAVNMKLVARAAKESKKVAVIVTADPAVVKLAMAAQIPVAKTLQSRPVVPTPEMIKDTENEEQIIDEDLAEDTPKNDTKDKKPQTKDAKAEGTKSAPKKTDDVINIDEDSLENDSKDKKNKKKSPKDKKVPNLEKYRKWIILGSVAGVLLIVFFVWALVFAPAAKITVAMHTFANNFNEPVTFTTDEAAANAEEGKFLVKQLAYEDKFEADFTATGQEDRGEKARGSLKVSYELSASAVQNNSKDGFSIEIPAGTEFTASNGLRYRATGGTTLSWDGAIGGDSPCKSNRASCTLNSTIDVEATNSGSNYDVGTSATWTSSVGGVTAKANSGISGGTTKMVTTVTQADINKAAEDRGGENKEAEGKAKLMEEVTDDEIAIEASYKVEVGDLKSSPGVGSETSDGKAHLSAVTTYSIYVVEKAKIEEFIDKKTELGEDQRIYSIGEPYFESFNNIDEGANLKTTIKVGPTVTEEDIIERTKGRKIGEVQSLLRSINGVSSVEVTPSYFWVRKVPKKAEKITVDMTVEDE